MTDTPRTDAEVARIRGQLDGCEDNLDYAIDQLHAHGNELERENARLRETLLTVRLRCGYIINGYGEAKSEAEEILRITEAK